MFAVFTAISYSGKFTPAYTVNNIDFTFKTTRSFNKTALLEVMYLPKTLQFNADDLEKDRQRIKKFYFDNGFFDAIIDTSVNYDSANYEVNIQITITENSRYTIKEMIIGGLDGIADNLKQSISSDRAIKAGDFYSKSNIAKETDRILNILQNNGYLNAGLDTSQRTEVSRYPFEVKDNPNYKNMVRVKLTFDGVNKVYRFGITKINIVNNRYHLGDDIIERELKYKENDIYSKENMTESERNLTKIPLIQIGRVQVDTVIEDASRVNMIVNISLNNKYTLTPEPEGKFIDNYFFIGGSLEYDDKNFFGGGRVFSISGEPLYHSNQVNRVDITFNLFQPFLFNNNITGNLKFAAIFYNFNEIFQFLDFTNSISLNYYIAPYTFYNSLTAALNTDLVRTKYKQDYYDSTNALFYKQGQIENLLNSVVSFTATHSSTDNLFNPSKGFFHSFTLEEAGLVPDLLNAFSKNINYSQYIKFYVLNYFYSDLSGGTQTGILANSIKLGDIYEFGKNQNIVPIQPQYKFFSGGGNSVRGWAAQRNGILDNTLDGGKFWLEGSMEYRWLMFADRTSFIKNFGIVGFIDYGNVWESASLFKFAQISLAAGFGVRYNTFVGPVRIDLGFKLFDPTQYVGNQWLFQNPSRIFIDKYAIQFGLAQAF